MSFKVEREKKKFSSLLSLSFVCYCCMIVCYPNSLLSEISDKILIGLHIKSSRRDGGKESNVKNKLITEY